MARSKPKAGPRTGKPVFECRPHVLNASAEAVLAQLTGLDADSRECVPMLQKIAGVLGEYRQLEQALDNSPRASDYMTTSAALVKHSETLLRALDTLSPVIYDNLLSRLASAVAHGKRLELLFPLDESDDIERTKVAIEKLHSAASILLREASLGRRKDGRPTREAMRRTVARLSTIYRRQCGGPPTPRKERGAIRFASDLEKNERAFIEHALAQIGVTISADSLRKLLCPPPPRRR